MMVPSKASGASAELTVAKIQLSGALFRADPRSCSQEDIEAMVALLDSATTQCSPTNVQKCKQWALENLVPSSGRMLPFGKYLVALSNSFVATGNETRPTKKPSAKRRRLYILYIINDILYHVKFRLKDESFPAKLEAFLPVLVRNAASYQGYPKHLAKVRDLIALWEEYDYFPQAFVGKLRETIETAPLLDNTTEAQGLDQVKVGAKSAKTVPFVLPAMHGDPTTPWYDLPAGNWLSVLEPNSTRPMNPSMIKPLQLAPGPASKTLVEAVKKLLVDVDYIYSRDASSFDDSSMDISPMGERIEYDDVTGEVVGGETYYGWSRGFCKQMKARRNKDGRADHRDSRGPSASPRSYSRSRSRSRNLHRDRSGDSSRSSSPPAFKRRRLSDVSDRGKTRSRSQSRSQSRSRRSRSRSGPSRESYRGRQPDRSLSRSSDSRSRSRGRKFEPRSPSYDRSRSRSRSGSYSPPPAKGGLPPRPPQQPSYAQPAPPPIPFPTGNMPWPIPPLPPQPGLGAIFGGLPPPPPPPPNYHGQWPPPPPPPPALGMGNPAANFFPGSNVAGPAGLMGGWLPGPTPPLPPQNNTFQYGRGGGGNFRGNSGEGRGRAGYGRGGSW